MIKPDTPVILLLLAVLALAGCVSRPVIQVPAADFQISGKLAVRGPGGNVSARFVWAQTGERYELEIWGPFGQGRRRLRGDDDRLQLLDGAGALLLEGPVGEVMRTQLGWELPLGSLRHWVQGREDPGLPVAEIDTDQANLLRRLGQNSWLITYPEYGDQAGMATRPRRLVARGEGYEIRLAISRWEV